jgi:hypothetical protein
MTEQVTHELLKGFLEAFNHHDLDSIMDYFADNCVFYMPRGAKPRGDRYVGKSEVRAGLAKRFEGIPDVHYGEDQHWVCGNFGVSEWTLTGTSVSGQHIEVRGVDLLEFAQGRSPARILSGKYSVTSQGRETTPAKLLSCPRPSRPR